MTRPLNHAVEADPVGMPAPRLLFVDDEQNIIAALRRLMRREGYDISSANSGDEALELLKNSEPFDLIVSDFRMPGMTGTELLSEVHKRYPDTIRIILSGYSEATAILDAINEGAIYKYFTKPWNDEHLKLDIRRAVEQQRLKRDNAKLADEVARQNAVLRELNRQLDRRASDAKIGLTFSQELLEVIDAGVMCIDPDGLVVGANTRFTELLPAEHVEFMGLPASSVLPRILDDALPDELANPASGRGRFEIAGRTLQWRCRLFTHEEQIRGRVLTIWEDTK